MTETADKLAEALRAAPTIERLLDSIADSQHAQDAEHDVIFYAAVDIIEAARAYYAEQAKAGTAGEWETYMDKLTYNNDGYEYRMVRRRALATQGDRP